MQPSPRQLSTPSFAATAALRWIIGAVEVVEGMGMTAEVRERMRVAHYLAKAQAAREARVKDA